MKVTKINTNTYAVQLPNMAAPVIVSRNYEKADMIKCGSSLVQQAFFQILDDASVDMAQPSDRVPTSYGAKLAGLEEMLRIQSIKIDEYEERIKVLEIVAMQNDDSLDPKALDDESEDEKTRKKLAKKGLFFM